MAAYAWGFLGVDQMGKTKGIKGELKARVEEIENGYPSSLVSCLVDALCKKEEDRFTDVLVNIKLKRITQFDIFNE